MSALRLGVLWMAQMLLCAMAFVSGDAAFCAAAVVGFMIAWCHT